jgi:hypothetical protein
MQVQYLLIHITYTALTVIESFTDHVNGVVALNACAVG